MKQIQKFISEVLFENGPVVLSINGNSMWPYYINGQPVKIYPLSLKHIKPGNCYVFTSNNTLTIHRLICTFSSFALFAGDSNNTIEIVNAEHIIGFPLENDPGLLRFLIIFVNFIFLPFHMVHFIFKIRKYAIRYIIESYRLK